MFIHTCNAADITALTCINYTGVVCSFNRTAVSAKQATNMRTFTSYINSTVVVNLVFVITISIITSTKNSTGIFTNQAADVFSFLIFTNSYGNIGFIH